MRKDTLIAPDTTKLKYFLTLEKNYQMWLSSLMTELSLKRLKDIIYENNPPHHPFSRIEIESCKNILNLFYKAKWNPIKHIGGVNFILEIRCPARETTRNNEIEYRWKSHLSHVETQANKDAAKICIKQGNWFILLS